MSGGKGKVAEMAKHLRGALGVVEKVSQVPTTLGAQLRHAIVAAEAPMGLGARGQYKEAMREVVAGALQKIEWGKGSGKNSREVFERRVCAVQLNAALQCSGIHVTLW